ncbi:hypothetical protein QTP86_005844 [Hemibagrus guttatus]|nr:hypothetical protein QTP86_005844 [Hemibagrus guttatus]
MKTPNPCNLGGHASQRRNASAQNEACAIELFPNTTPPKCRVYPLSLPETNAMDEYIKEALALSHIRPSMSPAAVGFFFVEKKDGGLRPCINYRGLNAITVRYSYPLPLVPAALEQLRGACIFIKLDLRSTYSLDLFNHYVIAYIDDILIYSASLTEHIQHMRTVLTHLKNHELYFKLEKCEFHSPTLSFLGYVLSPRGMEMDLAKAELHHNPNPPSPQPRGYIVVEVDASNSGIGAMLSQREVASGKLHACAYYSRKLTTAERNYDVGNRELLSIKAALEEWHHWLEGARHPFLVLTDHRNLEYL